MSNEKKPGTGVTNKRRKELAAAKLERQTARREQRDAKRRPGRASGSASARSRQPSQSQRWCSGRAGPPTRWLTLPRRPPPTATPSAVPVEGCTQAPTRRPTPRRGSRPRRRALEDGADYQLVLATTCGEIVVDTYPRRRPRP